ncbi:CLUMA_CG014209, isoform A [Clunio marinus]|uniref:CLUMA_CG014209, isoform A n=1 Tax=Clunio marinus TaxID=568069 RepID=A0A1J1IRB9_9DIPT|nr:CLUMA_CG014209, isoform A [Clunio marinus]
MKLQLVIASVLVCSAFAAPSLDNSNDVVNEEDVGRKNIKDQFDMILMLAEEDKFVKGLLNSIDQSCVLRKYKENHMLQDIQTPIVNIAALEEGEGIDAALVFGNIALSCSNKLKGVLAFIFENLMSYGSLIDVFRDEDPFKEFIDDLVCYNNYAVRSNFLDPNAYSHLNYELVNKTQEECDAEIAENKKDITELLDDVAIFVGEGHRNCYQTEIINTAEKIFMKYLLLIPLGLTDAQKMEEKTAFINDIVGFLERLLTCNANIDRKFTSKINKIMKNEISANEI